jgi:hypothetical protein
MTRVGTRTRPIPVTLISIYFLVAAAYLWIVAAALFLAPGRLSLMFGSRFMYGLEVAGPNMMLLVGFAYGLIGWGLYRLHNWARWLAMLVFVLAVACLVPKISAAEIGLQVFVCGVKIAILAAAGFYLVQSPTTLEAFLKSRSEKSMPRICADPQTFIHENARDPRQ